MEFHGIDAPDSLRGNQRRAVNILSLEMAFLLGADFQSALQGAVVLNAVIDRSRLLGYVAEPVERQAVLARFRAPAVVQLRSRKRFFLSTPRLERGDTRRRGRLQSLGRQLLFDLRAPFGEMSTQFTRHTGDFAVVLGKVFFV